MKDKLKQYVYEYPFEMGIVFIIIGLLALALRLHYRESSKMKNHSAMSWKAYLNSWYLIYFALLLGIVILFKFFKE